MLKSEFHDGLMGISEVLQGFSGGVGRVLRHSGYRVYFKMGSRGVVGNGASQAFSELLDISGSFRKAFRRLRMMIDYA